MGQAVLNTSMLNAMPTLDVSGHLRAPEPRLPQAEFDLRSECISCDSKRLRTVWQSSFGDNDIAPFLGMMGYDQSAEAALWGQPVELVRCADCSMTFHKHVLTDDWQDILYSQWITSEQIMKTQRRRANEHDLQFNRGVQRIKHCLRLNEMLNQRFRGPHRALDFGCGDGEFVVLAQSMGFEAVGVDRSTTRDARAQAAGVHIVPTLADVSAAPLHAVTLFQVLEHVTAPTQLLKQLHDKLAPKGVLVVEVPDCSDVTVPRNLSDFRLVAPTEHVNAFTPKTLATMCLRAGFEPVERVPAWVTTRPADLVRTSLSKLYQPQRTTAYFEKA